MLIVKSCIAMISELLMSQSFFVNMAMPLLTVQKQNRKTRYKSVKKRFQHASLPVAAS